MLAISDITGVEGEYIKTRNGYIGVLRMPGTDIINYQPGDQETTYRGFGQALQNCSIATKMVFMDVSPSLEEQKNHILYRLEDTKHPYRRELLMRQMRYMENLEAGQKERMAYLPHPASRNAMIQMIEIIFCFFIRKKGKLVWR